MGNDVVLLEHLGLPRAHVIGHSMGGASAYPSR
jgi:pimeloyl-ACP methyl ester carboxylesterase